METLTGKDRHMVLSIFFGLWNKYKASREKQSTTDHEYMLVLDMIVPKAIDNLVKSGIKISNSTEDKNLIEANLDEFLSSKKPILGITFLAVREIINNI